MIEYFNLSKDSIIGEKIPLSQFTSYLSSEADKKTILSSIRSMTAVATIRTEETNIPGFDDKNFGCIEIPIYEVEFKKGFPIHQTISYFSDNNSQVVTLAELLLKALPYQIILLIKLGNKYRIIMSVGVKSKKNPNRIVVRDRFSSFSFQTSWIIPEVPSPVSEGILSALDINQYKGNCTDLFDLYTQLYNKLLPYKSKILSRSTVEAMLKDKLNENNFAEINIDSLLENCSIEKLQTWMRSETSEIYYDSEDVKRAFSTNDVISDYFDSVEIDEWVDEYVGDSWEAIPVNANPIRPQINNVDYENKVSNNKSLIEEAVAFEKGDGINQNINKAIGKYLDALQAGFRIIDYVVYTDTMVKLARDLEDKNKKVSFELLIRASENGNAKAMSRLGCYYLESEIKDTDKAIECFIKAIELGDDSSIIELAKLYKEKILDIENIHDVKVITEMATIFEDGIKLNQDYEIAFKLFEKAANLDDGLAQYSLGRFYEKGMFVTKDIKAAFNWYTRAAEKSIPYAFDQLAYFFKAGLAVEKNIEKADYYYKEAAKYLQEWADKNDSKSQYLLGQLYKKGKGVNKDKSLFKEWNRKSEKNGYKKAQYESGFLYEEEKKLAMAFDCYKKSAEQNYPKAQNKLGECYFLGKGTNENIQQALVWFRKAAEQNNMFAQYQLGLYYEEQDKMDEAFKWYLKASENGNFNAMESLAFCYEKGEGIKKNLEQADKWYSEAEKKRNGNR